MEELILDSNNIEKKHLIVENNEYIKNKAKKSRSSYFVNWEVVSTLPRSSGGKKSLKDTPYKSRLR